MDTQRSRAYGDVGAEAIAGPVDAELAGDDADATLHPAVRRVEGLNLRQAGLRRT